MWAECRELIAAGYRVSVVCPKGDDDPAFEVLDGVRIHKYDPPPPAFGLAGYVYEFVRCWLQTAWRVARIAVRDRIDVLQTCNPPDTYWALAMGLKPFGTKFVFDQHDLCPEVYESRFGKRRGALYWMLRVLERGNYLVADHVISTNHSYRRTAITRGRVRPDHTTIVRSGPDPQRLYREAPNPELRHGKQFVCAYLGVMGPQDRVDLVVRAADHIVHQLHRRDIHFTLMGFGDCFDELKALTKELDLEDVITFTGRADDAMIRANLSVADLGLAPDPKSPLNDISTHNKVMEYMACEVPVLAFDLVESRVSAGDAARFVTDDEDPVAYAQAILALLDDPDTRAEMARAGRRRVVNELAWAHQGPHYVSVFDRLTGRGPRTDS